ncbi:MAG: hypothetical protein RIE86_19765 [Imperialibacter sp.]|uniref:hypothetical protein n=1 Tax=Imperialibacter sp. TaxID=2038411 RepID=UPI0032ED892C
MSFVTNWCGDGVAVLMRRLGTYRMGIPLYPGPLSASEEAMVLSLSWSYVEQEIHKLHCE